MLLNSVPQSACLPDRCLRKSSKDPSNQSCRPHKLVDNRTAVMRILPQTQSLKTLIKVLYANTSSLNFCRKHRIAPPAMTGHPDFERCVRVYENQLEQYIPFLTSMFLCAIFVNGNLAGEVNIGTKQTCQDWHLFCRLYSLFSFSVFSSASFVSPFLGLVLPSPCPFLVCYTGLYRLSMFST